MMNAGVIHNHSSCGTNSIQVVHKTETKTNKRYMFDC